MRLGRPAHGQPCALELGSSHLGAGEPQRDCSCDGAGDGVGGGGGEGRVFCYDQIWVSKLSLAAKWSMTQGQEGRVHVETQGGDSHSSGDRAETVSSTEDPTPLAQFSPPHTALFLRGPSHEREAGSGRWIPPPESK